MARTASQASARAARSASLQRAAKASAPIEALAVLDDDFDPQRALRRLHNLKSASASMWRPASLLIRPHKD